MTEEQWRLADEIVYEMRRYVEALCAWELDNEF